MSAQPKITLTIHASLHYRQFHGVIICSQEIEKENFAQSVLYYYFFFLLQSPCSNLPCKNNGKCISLYEKNSYVCVCKKIFTGKHCENCKGTAERTIGSFGGNAKLAYRSCAHGQLFLCLQLPGDRAYGSYNGK